MKEVIDVNVSFDTSFEDIELLRLEMEQFVRSSENSRDFQPDVAIGVGGVGDCDKLTLKIAIKHKSNWHNDVVRATRRSKFMCALTLALKRVPINGPGGGGDALGGPANPTYSVAVTDDFASSARAKSEQDKAAKKLATQTAEESANKAATTAAEVRAADNLNTTNPVIEALDDWGYENTLSGTAASRDPSADRTAHPAPSSSTVARVTSAASRSEVLSNSSTRESQRGRRKAGETLPPHALDGGVDNGMPSVHLTRTSTSTRGDKRSFDVERQAGAGAGYSSSWAYGGSTQSPPPVVPTPVMEEPAGFGGMQPLGRFTSPPTVGGHLAVQQPQQGQQQQQGAAVPGRPLVGSRSRGASVSRPPQEGQQGQGQGQGGFR